MKERWDHPDVVAGFARGAPNEVLLRFLGSELERAPALRVLDIGCGAGRNAVPAAEKGARVVGTDLSHAMLAAAAARALTAGVGDRVHLVAAGMERLPVKADAFDLVIAHGIWNLARSTAQFREGVLEAARTVRPGAGLFVFTFSRHTLPADARPVPGEDFVFTEFAGEPQCFLTEEQLVAELGGAGFDPEGPGPLTEYNRPRGGDLTTGGPVLYEGIFRMRRH